MLKKTFLTLALLLGLTLSFAPISDTAWAQVSLRDSIDSQFDDFGCPAGLANCEEKVPLDENGNPIEETGEGFLKNVVFDRVGTVLNFAAIIAVIAIVIAGVRFVLAVGDAEAVTAARKHLLWTIGGLLAVILSLLIVRNITEVVYEATEGEVEECAPIDVDGKHGPQTEGARQNLPNLGIFYGTTPWTKTQTGLQLTEIEQFQEMYNEKAEELSCKADISKEEAFCGILDSVNTQNTGKLTGAGIPSAAEWSERGDVFLAQVCELMGFDSATLGQFPDDLSTCNVKAVQKKLGGRKEKADPLPVGGFYLPTDDPGCTKIDGVYGNCTADALERYFAFECTDGEDDQRVVAPEEGGSCEVVSDLKNSLPDDSCFVWGQNSAGERVMQYFKPNEPGCSHEVSLPEETKKDVCSIFEIEDCTIEAIQKFLIQRGSYNTVTIKQCSADFKTADGDYGLCTQSALINYLDFSCSPEQVSI